MKDIKLDEPLVWAAPSTSNIQASMKALCISADDLRTDLKYFMEKSGISAGYFKVLTDGVALEDIKMGDLVRVATIILKIRGVK
jgi:hypothetical protein